MGSQNGNNSNPKDGSSEFKEKEVDGMDIVKAIAVAAGVVSMVGWGISKLVGTGSETSDNRKTMKAPGRDGRIYRDDFERDPATYFRKLRK